MGKKLSEMTLEELWQLFPIVLTRHNEKWKEYYDEILVLLEKQLSGCKLTRISHIGSTAVKNICAKPIIDVLVEISAEEDMAVAARLIAESGFVKMSESKNRVSFNYGYTEEGFAEKVYHIHLRYAGDNDELYFRDYINDNYAVAKEYERLKLDLWYKYEHDRDAYTEAKTEFIEKYTQYAKRLYENRY